MYFALDVSLFIIGPGRVRPLYKQRSHFSAISPETSLERPFASVFRLNVINVKCIFAKVMTDRWWRNDFQNSGQACGTGSAVACLGSAHSALTVANRPFFPESLKCSL